MAIRFCGTVRVAIFASDEGGLDGRYYYEGTIYADNRKPQKFSRLSPAPSALVHEGRKLAIDSTRAYDRAAAAALPWWGYDEAKGCSGDESVIDVGADTREDDRGSCNLYQISRTKGGPVVYESE